MAVKQSGLLYIEPSARVSAKPVIDTLTRKMAAAYRLSARGTTWRGWHRCACGANSTNADYVLPGGAETNSLCVHYLAFHRSEVPAEQLAKVRRLNAGEVEPTEQELHGWKS